MTDVWPSLVRVRRPAGRPDVVLRALRGRDRAEWEGLRAANVDWLRPWEAMAPQGEGRLRFGQLVRHYDREGRAGRAQPFVIECDGAIVGQMHLTQIVWGSARSAQAGYWVAREAAGRGIAPTALAALVDHAFLGLGLHRVAAYVQPENSASLRVLGKLGFRDEGVRRRVLYVDGAWRDHRSFALTVEDLEGESLVRRWNASDAARAADPPRRPGAATDGWTPW